VFGHEVADPEGADPAVGEQRLQGAVGLQGPVECRRKRLVQDQQVDLVDAELPGALDEPVQRLVVAVGRRGVDEAVAGSEGALEMNEAMGARPWLAHTRFDYGSMLVARDRPGDRRLAEELLAAAASLAAEVGMLRLSERTARLRSSLT
jgi:hypothetical protein